jgi:hypothetical protein
LIDDAGSVKESGQRIQSNIHMRFIRMADNAAIYEIGSGDYDFSSTYWLN